MEVGLLTPTAAREIARLPAGNQSEVLDLSRREALSRDELGGVVRLLLGSITAEQKLFVLTKPRDALEQDGAAEGQSWDPRLSTRGNRVSKQLEVLLDRLAWAENFLQCRRLDSASGAGPPGPGTGIRPAGAERGVRGGGGRRPGHGDATAMNDSVINKIVALFHGGASVRRIARSLGVSRRTVDKALRQVEQARDGRRCRGPGRVAACSTRTNR